MARIRTIKPEFFRHEELYQAEKESGLPLRVAFAGLWTVADREGRFRWKPTQIKLDVLPYDKLDMANILSVLTHHQFVIKYSVGGESFGMIPSFKTHQVINVREAKSKLPAPDGNIDAPELPLSIPEGMEDHPDKKISRHIPAATKRAVFTRDDFKCVRCGSDEYLSIDHIFPFSCGGTHALTNLRLLCRSCNSARPVQGEALERDLASDGLTWNDMKRICSNVHAHGELEKEGKGKGREHIQVACAVCSIFGKHYLLPDERLPQTANWFRTIDQQVDKLLEVWKPDEAVKQILAYIRHCDDTGRKRVATDYKVAETLFSVNWIGIAAPDPVPKDSNPYAEAEHNRKLWTEEAWRKQYASRIKTDAGFREYFKLQTTQ